MANKKDLILIPYWIKEALERNGLPLSSCLDLGKIKPILSLKDLVLLVTLQKPFFQNIVTGVEASSGSLTMAWVEGIGTANSAPDRELLAFRSETILPLSEDESNFKELAIRLFDKDSFVSRYENPFIIYDLTPDTIGVVIYPGHFTIPNNIVLQKQLIESVIETMYAYAPFHEVAKTVYFKRYLTLLSGA